MAAPKPDPGPAVKAAGKGGGNVLTKKIGPLPGWAWAGIALGGFYFYRYRKAQAAASSSATTATPAASLPTSDTTAPSGYAYQGPGTGGSQSAGGPGWNVGTPTGATGVGDGIQPGGVFQPAPGTTPSTSAAQVSSIVAQDNAFTQQLANQTGVAQTGVTLNTPGSNLPGGASFITNPAANDPYYNPQTGI